ncbi:HesA/MoeB/ThiF family protein [Zavarzinella formosa]|uniref:HesA/MoeB/ThiF family protein n=1 Tax=Zavarzinella formosa TaxID=360055 RepID=UPI00031C251F|nr:HesA/MoeB/ThiF family protein [Zavarzinella formosa]
MTPDLTPEEQATYEWQTWIPGFGEEGQRRLKAATVLISRLGGVGGTAAYALAAAGVGRMILAHAGKIKRSDLNRQLLMTHAGLGTSRLDSAVRRLKELNPRLVIEGISENLNETNADQLVQSADVAVCCGPLFEERLAMNAACVRHGKPMIDGAMHELTGQLSTMSPGRTACLACRVPEIPPTWKRQFPVLGAVSGTVGMLAAAEVVKILTGIGEPLFGRLLTFDLRDMRFRTVNIRRRPDCSVCGGVRNE